MMNEELYSMIHRRRSFRTFTDERLTQSEAERIISGFDGELGTYSVTDKDGTSCPKGDAAFIYYGDKEDPLALVECGYRVEKLDLYLQKMGIGVCWYGFGRAKEKTKDGKDFIIMLALGYLDEKKLRSNDDEFVRNDISAIWEGDFDINVKSDVRLAPSACNSQPWKVLSEGNVLSVYRTEGNPSIMKGRFKEYFNSIDIGIFLAFLEISLTHHGYSFEKKVLSSNNLVAQYKINQL